MYGIFTYIHHKNQPNVGKHTIHGSYGYGVAMSVASKMRFASWTHPSYDLRSEPREKRAQMVFKGIFWWDEITAQLYDIWELFYKS